MISVLPGLFIVVSVTTCNLSRDTAFPMRWHVRPAKIDQPAQADQSLRCPPEDALDPYPAGTQHQNDVVSTSMRRDHVASTLIRRHFNIVCPLG